MVGIADDDQLVLEEGNDFQLAHLGGEGNEAEVHGIVQDILIDKVGPPVLDPDIDRGILLEELGDVGRQLVEPDTVDGRNVNGAADDLLHLLQVGNQLLIAVEDLLGAVVKFLALEGEAELFLTPVDNKDSKVFFHRPELLAHRRLGDAVELGGPGK